MHLISSTIVKITWNSNATGFSHTKTKIYEFSYKIELTFLHFINKVKLTVSGDDKNDNWPLSMIYHNCRLIIFDVELKKTI